MLRRPLVGSIPVTRRLLAGASPASLVEVVPCLKDNYAYVVHGASPTMVVDPGEAGPVERALKRMGVKPEYVLVTHHHDDHVGGVPRLKEAYPDARIVACAADADRMPVAVDIPVNAGSTVDLGGVDVEVVDTGGHTLNHVAFHIPGAGAVFTGDALFVLGCGRIFEGTAEQMHASLGRLAALPQNTRVYCGHEYTIANATFARAIDPKHAGLRSRLSQLQVLRGAGMPTVPTTIGSERELNVFLRADDPVIQESVSMSMGASETIAEPVKVFAALRRMKDNA